MEVSSPGLELDDEWFIELLPLNPGLTMLAVYSAKPSTEKKKYERTQVSKSLSFVAVIPFQHEAVQHTCR